MNLIKNVYLGKIEILAVFIFKGITEIFSIFEYFEVGKFEMSDITEKHSYVM